MKEPIVIEISRGIMKQEPVALVGVSSANEDIVWKPFLCDPAQFPGWDAEQAVLKRGQMLWRLLDGHEEVKSQLVDRLKNINPDEVCPIYFQIRGVTEAEQLCWESLWDKERQFLALHGQWPIGRIAGAFRNGRFQDPENVSAGMKPLRLMAVMSALPHKATQQWAQLYDCVKNARQDGLEVEVRAVVGEEALLASMEQEAEADPQLHVTPLSQLSIELGKALNDFEPHVVHFFCHGSVTQNVPRLALASYQDWQGLEPRNSSLNLNLEQLLSWGGLRRAWLVTLNCCEGGMATRDVSSLACRLVRGGVAAAVGMAEAIDVNDAHQFCAAFYPAVFKKLKAALGQVRQGQEARIEWADALNEPRATLRDLHDNIPESQRYWTLPVLYVRPAPFRLRLQPPTDPTGATDVGLPFAPTALSPDTQRGYNAAIRDLLSKLPPEEAKLLFAEVLKVRQEEGQN